MDVAGAAPHRVRQNVIDQLDHWRFFRCLFQFRQVERSFVFRFEFDAFRLTLVNEADDFLDLLLPLRLFRRAVMLLDGFRDGRFGGDHWLDVEPRHKLDIVHGEDVRGVHHRHGQRRTHPAEREDLVFCRRLHRDKLDYVLIHFEVTQVDRRNAVLARENCSDFVIAQET